jgi:hypothetical protein
MSELATDKTPLGLYGKQELARRIYRMVNELNRAIDDAARYNIHTNLRCEPAPPSPDGTSPHVRFVAEVFEHVSFAEDPAAPPPPPPAAPAQPVAPGAVPPPEGGA